MSPIKQFSEVSGALNEANPQCFVVLKSVPQQVTQCCIKAQPSDHAPHPSLSFLFRIAILVHSVAGFAFGGFDGGRASLLTTGTVEVCTSPPLLLKNEHRHLRKCSLHHCTISISEVKTCSLGKILCKCSNKVRNLLEGNKC